MRFLPALLAAVVLAAPVHAQVLSFEGAVVNGTAGVDGLRLTTALAASPDGRNVYATAEGDDSVVVLSRGPGGQLLFTQAVRDGGGVDGLDGAIAVAVAPGGEHVYVAGTGDDAVAILARNPGTGVLTFVGRVRDGEGGIDGLAGVRGVAVSPDGAHVYAAGTDERSIVVFARDGGTGGLTFVGRVVDGQGGVDGIAGVQGIVVSGDGLNVYAAGTDDDAVAVFTRDAQTGALTWIERRRDGGNGVNGLAGAIALALSPDGAHLYVVGADDDAVAVFARSPGTGALTFVEQEEEGRRGVTDMGLPLSVTVSPDGGYVFVAASSGRAVAAFARDASTGRLLFLERRRDGEDGVEGLIGADGVAASPDGTRLWVTARTSGAVTSFVVTAGITSTTTTPSSTSTTSTTIPRCGSRPRSGCHQPAVAASGLLLLKDRPDDGDRLVWRWRTGDATNRQDLGDPRTATGYRLCMWETGRRPRLILDSRALPGERCGRKRCWRSTPTGFKYANRTLRPDGLRTLRLKTGARGKAAITIAGGGRRLGMPRLPLSAPVTVQLRSGTGECWSAEYGRPRVNSRSTFRAKAD
jgi:6-phosphogluconolactonase (cycloisomerase 2 family)